MSFLGLGIRKTTGMRCSASDGQFVAAMGVGSFLVLTSACVNKGPRLNRAPVIAITDRVAVKDGYSSIKFERSARYNLLKKDNSWILVYRLKPGSQGMVPVSQAISR